MFHVVASKFEASRPDGLCPGWSVRVKGETSSSTNTFQINFLCDPGEQVALHFNPRFADSVIICNSFLDNCWGQEVVTDTFPLEPKEPFQIEIYSDQNYFHVFVDENKVLQYEHRHKQLSTIFKVQILDDIQISSVEVTRRGLY
ncbi:grifin [Eublepharis macularius]|uniref:Galectin n=1 Tax=Eublepharis macularius TaxID=481883 RepID=A0AA97LBI9_EUBMA|nr:grifin [Eublepharis macularius]